MVSVDWAQEEANKLVKHDAFNHGLPTPERVESQVLSNDRIRAILQWTKDSSPPTSESYYYRDTEESEKKIRLMLKNNGFLANYSDPGNFQNLSGEKMNKDLER